MTQVTLSLADGLVERAEAIAQRSGRSVNDLLAETIELSLKPWSASSEPTLADGSDAEVMTASELQMSPQDDRRLSELLDRQQAAALTATEQAELNALMQVYQEGLLRKAEALREAVRRGLRAPVQP